MPFTDVGFLNSVIEQIPLTAPRGDGLRPDDLSQSPDIGLDNIIIRTFVKVIELFYELLLGEYLSGPAHKAA